VERAALPRHLSVSELSKRFAARQSSGPGEELPAVSSDDLIEDGGLAGFFGTLCHHLIETALAAGAGDGAVAAPSLGELPLGLRREAMRRGLAEKDYARLAADAEALAAGFLASELAGRIAKARHESEVPFVLHRELGGVPAWISGQIDLLAQSGGITVVDFKTDRTFRPDAHRLQLALYREAASELYGTEARAFVYYLRDGRIEEAGPMPALTADLLREPAPQASNTR
jgi:ATP-dependent exoDNAse (exonuclease V) beta subunit